MAAHDNWYLVLELPFEPLPEQDPQVIAARVAEKVTFWSTHANNARHGVQYSRWRELAGVMVSDLADPATRERMAEEAVQLKFGDLDRLLLLTTDQGRRPLAPTTAQRVATRVSLQVEQVVDRACSLRIPVEEVDKDDQAEHQALIDLYTKRRPDKYTVFDGYRKELAPTGAPDLYAFLMAEASSLKGQVVPGTEADEIDRLVATVEGVDDARKLTSTTLARIGQTLNMAFLKSKQQAVKSRATVGKLCTQAFANDEMRRAYDTFLDFLALRDQIQHVSADLSLVSRRLSETEAQDYVARLDGHLGSTDEAAALFLALCRVTGSNYDPPEGGTRPTTAVCRCGAVTDTTTGAAVCSRCGQPLKRSCPRCNLVHPNVHNFCSCGFDFYDEDRAAVAADLALKAAAAFHLGAAKSHLAEARGLFAQHPDVARATEAVDRLDRSLGKELAVMEQQVTDLNLHAAQDLLSSLVERVPQFGNPELSAHLRRQIATATTKLREAEKATDARVALAACRDAYALCRDLPGLQEVASRHTDLPLDALSVGDAQARKVTVSVVNHRVAVRLESPEAGPAGVLVAYRFDAFPSGPSDPGAIVREFTLAELEQEGLLKLEAPQNRTYFVSVHLTFRTKGRTYHSRGEYAKLDLATKVVLTYSLRKKLFSTNLILELTADRQTTRIPEIALVWSVGNAPVFEESAQPLEIIPAQQAVFPWSRSITLPRLPKNAFVKPFVHDDDSFQLKLATNSTHKVT